MELRDFCIICGANSDEVDMVETEDGFICIDCAGESIDSVSDNEEDKDTTEDDNNGLKII